MLRSGWIVAVWLLASPCWCAEPAAAQWVVVTAPAFRKAIEPLCQQRKSQGLHVVVVRSTDVLRVEDIRAGKAGQLRKHINKLCRDHKGPSFVLLVGAVAAGRLAEADKIVLPTLPGTIGRMKGKPSDNGYGCLDDDRLPTVAVGRFPARTEEEARGMVAKTLAYEGDARPGLWRRLIILAGIPAYNPFVDRMVESLAFARFARLSPMWTGRAIYSNPQSRFCLPDDLLHKRALQYVEEGEAFTLYLGHSSAEGLYGGRAPSLDRDDWSHLRIERGQGVFVTFGCNGCQLKGDNGEGYGVAAMRNGKGPAAVVGSHGICFAAMVQLAADGLFESTFAKSPPKCLGDSWLAIQNGVARGKIDDLTFGLLDAVDGDKTIPQATQRQEHLEMFVLLGDPALRLPVVQADVELTTAATVSAGEKLSVKGKVPACLAGAKVYLTLERAVNSVPDDLEAMPKAAAAARDRAMLANHERANRFVLTARACMVKDGRFQTMLDVPAKLPWPRLILRVYAANKSDEGMAVRILEVTKSSKARQEGEKSMSQHYQADGISFRYPDNWRLDREESEDGWTVLLQSPGTAFLMLTRDRSGASAEEVAAAALAALQADYPALEAQPQVDTLAGQMAVGHDIQFFSLDLTNTCWTRSISSDAGTVLILWQSNDLELDEYEPVLRAIRASLAVEETWS